MVIANRIRTAGARVVAGVALVSLFAAGCGRNGDGGTVVARIGKGRVTAEQMDARMKSLPPQVAQQYEGNEGQQKFLEGFIEEETWYQAALAAEVDKDPEVRRQADDAVRRVVIQNYFARELQPYTVMTEEELKKIYDENIELYTKPKEFKVRHIMCLTRAEAEQVRKKLLAGADMEALARDVSVDEYTRKEGGLMGHVAENSSLIPYVGSAPTMTAAIDSLPLHQYSDVIQSPRGYHVIRVEEISPEAPLPFDKLKERIRREYQQANELKVRNERLEQLKQEFGVTIVEAGLRATEKTRMDEAERLFAEAQESTEWQTRLDLYNQFLTKFPDDPHAHEAHFMMAFIYAEELKDYAKAQDAFRLMIERYPDSPLADDARFMLDNLYAQEPPQAAPDGAVSDSAPAVP